MTGWIIGLSVVLLFALILFSSVRLKLFYEKEEFRVLVGFWFLFFQVYPVKDKKEKKKGKTPKQKKEKIDGTTKPKPQKEKKLSLDFILLLIKSAWKGLKVILKHVRITGLRLHIVVGDEDAAECALLYGKVSAFLNGGLSAAKNLMMIQVKDVTLDCDFSRKDVSVDGSCTVQMKVVFLFGAVIRMLYCFIANTIEDKNTNRKV